ncbi:unnamed protein product, partial [Protopolystoma xenopodis]
VFLAGCSLYLAVRHGESPFFSSLLRRLNYPFGPSGVGAPSRVSPIFQSRLMTYLLNIGNLRRSKVALPTGSPRIKESHSIMDYLNSSLPIGCIARDAVSPSSPYSSLCPDSDYSSSGRASQIDGIKPSGDSARDVLLFPKVGVDYDSLNFTSQPSSLCEDADESCSFSDTSQFAMDDVHSPPISQCARSPRCGCACPCQGEVLANELSKRCQHCRVVILAAKEKQEGEARKNANCLLEQIEQEEEELAKREALQAKKRERKRMKRKAKQEKERQGKGVVADMSHYSPTPGKSPDSGSCAEDNGILVGELIQNERINDNCPEGQR